MKKTRNMCTTIAAMNSSAAQWCICRMIRPPRTSNERSSDVSYAWRHLDAAQRRVAAVVVDLGHRRVEEQRQERAGQQQDDERVERDLAEQERPVVREDLVQQPPQRGGRPGSRSSTPGPRPCAGQRRFVDVDLVGVFMAAPRSRARRAPVVVTSPRRSPRRPPSIGSMRQPPGGRAEDRPGVVGDVELRLVARAEQPVGLLLVQAGRAAGVGADLRVRHEVAPSRCPPWPRRRWPSQRACASGRAGGSAASASRRTCWSAPSGCRGRRSSGRRR